MQTTLTDKATIKEYDAYVSDLVNSQIDYMKMKFAIQSLLTFNPGQNTWFVNKRRSKTEPKLTMEQLIERKLRIKFGMAECETERCAIMDVAFSLGLNECGEELCLLMNPVKYQQLV